ncbi:uncharacterized protein LOC111716530 [Eurytemora carolleeae]|uniref:uncharacterized protein LOC111716530 n=1 Tax=Eurytemora carolleeae TaxID=1294199 RepID=UPI000C7734E5|nr:uncharacterized protein LOC111716530 [Eurytemora carolleeae]|eukprot:XP_023347782.1 uncharacterized protein LOC111716530 [Eurytemora affinis]
MGRGTDPKNMKLYIHETGLFGSGYEVKFQTEWYEGNTVVLLDLEQIINIPDPSVCNQVYLFDKCKQRYISEEFKAGEGCSLKLPRSAVDQEIKICDASDNNVTNGFKTVSKQFKRNTNSCLLPCSLSLIGFKLFSYEDAVSNI